MMQLEIVTPEKKIYSGEVEIVNLPGTDGSFGVLEGHAPIISTLKKGIIKVTPTGGESKEISFDVQGGVVEVNNNKIIVLAE